MGQLGVPAEKRKCLKEKTDVDLYLFKPGYLQIYLKLKTL